MSIHMQREIENLKKRILSLWALVEEQVESAVQALTQGDEELARLVESRDTEVDRREVDLEEDCLKILALHQPVASDLRFVVAVFKINSDLERIADLAVNIARKAAILSREGVGVASLDLAAMWTKTRAMLRGSIEAFIHGDAALAHRVCALDNEVDEMKRVVRLRVEKLIRESPDQVHSLLSVLAVPRNLERISDHATNIAEDVIYMVEGRIVRHEVVSPPRTSMR